MSPLESLDPLIFPPISNQYFLRHTTPDFVRFRGIKVILNGSGDTCSKSDRYEDMNKLWWDSGGRKSLASSYFRSHAISCAPSPELGFRVINENPVWSGHSNYLKSHPIHLLYDPFVYFTEKQMGCCFYTLKTPKKEGQRRGGPHIIIHFWIETYSQRHLGRSQPQPHHLMVFQTLPCPETDAAIINLLHSTFSIYPEPFAFNVEKDTVYIFGLFCPTGRVCFRW